MEERWLIAQYPCCKRKLQSKQLINITAKPPVQFKFRVPCQKCRVSWILNGWYMPAGQGRKESIKYSWEHDISWPTNKSVGRNIVSL